MKNMGMWRADISPLRAGGLTDQEVAYLVGLGWIRASTEKDVEEAPIGFAAPELPGGYTMHNYSIPAGTEYLYNPEDERAIILDCGNPTCWRYLMK